MLYSHQDSLIDCSNQSLTDIYQSVPTAVKTLYLDGNNLTCLNAEIFNVKYSRFTSGSRYELGDARQRVLTLLIPVKASSAMKLIRLSSKFKFSNELSPINKLNVISSRRFLFKYNVFNLDK
jgi:hypothetical protein